MKALKKNTKQSKKSVKKRLFYSLSLSQPKNSFREQRTEERLHRRLLLKMPFLRLLPETEKTYSAGEIGKMLGISAVRVGKITNANGLKTEKYGKLFADKSRYSNKEVETFRYNEDGVAEIKRLFSVYSEAV